MITFNGKSASEFADIISIMAVHRPISPGARSRIIEIARRSGVLYLGKDRNPKVITFRIALRSTSNAALRESAREIAAWLDTDEPKILTFSDEPELQYRAIILDQIDSEEFAAVGLADVEFFVPSGYAENIATKTTGGSDTNAGTEKCPCIITVTMTEAVSSLKVTLAATGEFVLINQALIIDDVVVIDTAKHLVTINSLDSRIHVTYDSDYFKLPVGAFSISADGASTISVEFRELFK